MENIVDLAAQVVAERDACYDGVIADMYYMAMLAENWETAWQIWQEAWEDGSAHLVTLLAEVDMQQTG